MKLHTLVYVTQLVDANIYSNFSKSYALVRRPVQLPVSSGVDAPLFGCRFVS